jgi:hypothetical protein
MHVRAHTNTHTHSFQHIHTRSERERERENARARGGGDEKRPRAFLRSESKVSKKPESRRPGTPVSMSCVSAYVCLHIMCMCLHMCVFISCVYLYLDILCICVSICVSRCPERQVSCKSALERWCMQQACSCGMRQACSCGIMQVRARAFRVHAAAFMVERE